MREKNFILTVNEKPDSYPWKTAAFVIAAILIAPFTSPYLALLAFVVQLFRLVKYDISTACSDLAFLIPFMEIYRAPGGDALMAYYVLILNIVIIWRRPHITANKTLIVLLLAFLYFPLRVGLKLSTIAFVCGGLLFLYLVFDNREMIDETNILYFFISGAVASTAYALIFIGSSSVSATVRIDSNVNDGRFRGLFADPNYYSLILVLAMVALLIFYSQKKIKSIAFFPCFALLLLAGILTVSKSFFLMLAVITLYYMINWFVDRKFFKGMGSLVVFVFLAHLVFLGKIPFLNNIISRFLSAGSLSDLTTGRTELWGLYIRHSFQSFKNVLFGEGFDVVHYAKGSHNVYIEALYNTGIIGVGIFFAFFIFVFLDIKRDQGDAKGKISNKFMSFLPLMAVSMMYFFLHGISSVQFYFILFIMFISYKQGVKGYQRIYEV